MRENDGKESQEKKTLKDSGVTCLERTELLATEDLDHIGRQCLFIPLEFSRQGLLL